MLGKILGAFIFLKARLQEPSTLASISAVLALFGTKIDPGIVQDFLITGTLVFGALGFFVKEQPPVSKV